MHKSYTLLFSTLLAISAYAQLPLVRDTITVMENGRVLKMPWGNGFNSVNASSIDLDLDGKKDLVLFDHYNGNSEGRFRCFINTGNSGATMYRADTYISYRFPRTFNWAVFYDYNNDGKEDLFCSGNNVIMVYKNVGTPGNSPAFTLYKSALTTNLTPTSTPFITPIYASIVGVPGIADIDNDGDLDIIGFSALGTFVELQKNMRVEHNLPPDSLVFEYASSCWGKVAESNCSVDFNLCNGSGPLASISGDPKHKELHAGSCLSCFDEDGDGDKDLLMGDITCDRIQFVHNDGTPTAALFNDTTKLYPNYRLKNTTTVKINTFPCAYVLDVDGDNKKDLLVSPNASSGSENFQSLWYYHNTSNTSTVNFQYVKNNFFQDEMIEVGQNSFPVLFDYDSDGKKDLLIGTYGYYINKSLQPRLTLYRNIGTTSQPSYSLISRDYCNLSQQSNISMAIPTVGDVDGDGDVDILIGTLSGQIHWIENTAGAGNVSNFSNFKNNPFQFTTNSAVAAPQLFDLDQDGLLDLLIGTKNGRIAYYKNTGTITSPSFSLITNSLGNVLINDDPNIFGYDGYAVPFFYKENASIKLLAGTITGKIFQYTVPVNILANYNLVTPFVNGFYEGGQSSLCYEDVNNDGLRDLFIGSASGGLCFFTTKSPLVGQNELSNDKLTAAISLYPNPANSYLNVNVNSIGFEHGTIEVYDLPGKKQLDYNLSLNTESLDISSLANGVYFVKINLQVKGQPFGITKKIIKE